MAAPGVTGVEIKTGFFPLAFLLFMCTPRIEIDGRVNLRPWGTHFFELPPGPHTIRVYFRYLWMGHCGDNSVSVNVPAGRAVRVNYNMPPWMLAKGSMTVS